MSERPEWINVALLLLYTAAGVFAAGLALRWVLLQAMAP
jgi:hypothetical protein